MEVHLNPEQEARLHQLASRPGRNPEQMLEQAVDRMLDYDEHFLAAVEEGRATAKCFQNSLARDVMRSNARN